MAYGFRIIILQKKVLAGAGVFERVATSRYRSFNLNTSAGIDRKLPLRLSRDVLYLLPQASPRSAPR